MKKIYKSTLVIVILITVTFALFKISKSRTFQFYGNLTHQVETSQKVVALTFDDAPSPYSNQVVDILAEKNIKATFYLIGRNIKDFPQETKYIIDHGHEVGNHSYSHQRFLLKPLSFIDYEIQTTNQLNAQAGYHGNITFRPPYGKKLVLLPWYLNQHQITTVMWDVAPDSYVPGDTDALVSYTLDHTKPGSILLLHPFCSKACAANREALPQIIDQLTNQGYSFATVSELINLGQ